MGNGKGAWTGQDRSQRYASASDYRCCQSIHRRFGPTYYFSTWQFPPVVRKRTHALYGFVRVPDEWVDNPVRDGKRVAANLKDYRNELLLGFEGIRPANPVLRAFCDVAMETRIPVEEPLAFLDSMEQDLLVTRYETFEDLRRYMRGSAAAVGVMMCYVVGARAEPTLLACARALGEAMQLTNFVRDVAEDASRTRIYLPLEDLSTFEVTEDEILHGTLNERVISLFRFEIARARALYRIADQGIVQLPKSAQKAVRLARLLYSRILDSVESKGYDVFRERAGPSTREKLTVAARVMVGLS